MNYKAHRVGGVCFGVVASCLICQTPITPQKLVLSSTLVAGAYIGSLIPDIDHPNSFLGKKVKIISVVINKIFGHRGITHTPLICFLFGALLLLLGSYFNGLSQIIYSQFAIGIIVGYLSHLIMDGFTISGIPLLYPLTKKNYNLSLNLIRFKTGKDDFLVAFIWIVCTCLFVAHYIGLY